YHKFHWTESYLVHTFVKGILTADMFFLYFLLVSMQLYVVFPLMLKFMRKFQNAHMAIFIISFAVEIGLMAFNQSFVQFVNIHHVPGWVGDLVKYRDRIIITYEFWFVAGALLAIHYQTVKAWALAHVRMIVSILVAGLFVLWGVYFLNRFGFGLNDSRALDVLQPVMIPYSLVVAAVLWIVGMKWQRVSSELPVLSRIIRFFGSVSFGIFLIHPVTLHYVDKINSLVHASLGVHFALLPLWIALTYVVSGCVAYLIGRVPYLSYIVGEKTQPKRRAPAAPLSKAV
ncbi:acyltransferase family protein, partial [Alicyclobacillus acidiphilus]